MILAIAFIVGIFLFANMEKNGVIDNPRVVIPAIPEEGGNQNGGDLPLEESPETQPIPEPIPVTPKPDPTPTPIPSGSAEVIRKVATSEKVVVLTFDAGADKGFTSQILDTLKSSDIHASFGMTGKWAAANPDLVKRMANEGHDFINHTYNHNSFTGYSTNSSPLSNTVRWDELDRTEKIIKDMTGKSTLPYFRPPYGDYDSSVNKDIYSRGYRFNIMWTVDSLGWKGLTKEEIRTRAVNGTVPGAIHLMHVGEQSQDAAALLLIISDLKSKGYTFGRISDLVK